MADSVVKLKLDSGEYDSKIKRAAQNVLSFGENCQKAGQSVAKADKETLDYVRSIGQMETVAKNTKGKINEMATAFTDLSVQYKNLTDEEKKSQFGVALSQSLDQLKTRIGESKAQLTEVNAELGNTSSKGNETGGVLDALAGKFGLNINQVGAFGVALGAATVATKVAKDAFFSNEEQLDEWGRVVESSRSVYRGFLDALNTGDISGYLSRISTIVQAARDAYDALDELATFNAFNQVNVARARQAFMDAQNDYREGTGSKDKVKAAGSAVKAELDQRRDLEKKAYSTEIVKLARERGVNPVDLARVMLGSYGDYRKIKNMPLTGTRSYTMTDVKSGQTWQQTTKVAANEMERMGAMLRRFNDTELQKLQGLGAQFFNTGFEKGQIDRQINRIVNGRGGAGSTGGGSTSGGGRSGGSGGGGGRGGAGGGGTHQETPEEKAAKLVAAALGNYENAVSTATLRFEMGMDNSEEQQKKLLAAQERLTMAYADAYNITQDENYKTKFGEEAGRYNQMEDVVKGKRDLFNTATADLAGMSVNPMEGVLKGLLGEDMETYAKRKGIDLDTDKDKPGKKEDKTLVAISNTIDGFSGGLSQITGGLEQLGIDVPNGIERMITTMQVISTILTGINTVVMTIAALSVIPFARGGIAHAASGLLIGHHYSGDMVPALLNDGELILNRSQQGNVASALRNNGLAGMQLEATLDGEEIRLAIRNGDRRRGRGEYAYSKTR